MPPERNLPVCGSGQDPGKSLAIVLKMAVDCLVGRWQNVCPHQDLMDAPSSGKLWDYGSNIEPEACALHVTRDTTHPLLFSQKEGKAEILWTL